MSTKDKNVTEDYAFFRMKQKKVSPFKVLSWLRRTHLGVVKASQTFNVEEEQIYEWINQYY